MSRRKAKPILEDARDLPLSDLAFDAGWKAGWDGQRVLLVPTHHVAYQGCYRRGWQAGLKERSRYVSMRIKKISSGARRWSDIRTFADTTSVRWFFGENLTETRS